MQRRRGLLGPARACRRGAFAIFACGLALPVPLAQFASAAELGDVSDDLSGSIEELERQINEETKGAAPDPALRALRQKIASLLADAKAYVRSAQYDKAEQQLAEAERLAAGDSASQTRVMLAKADLEIERQNFDAAEAILDEVSRRPEITEKARTRIADLRARSKQRQTKLAARAEKQKAAAERAALQSRLYAIEAMPPDEALPEAETVYRANPGDTKIANFYARQLARSRRWDDAERIYLGMVDGMPTNDLSQGDNPQTVLGLVDLYQRTNRMASAGLWLGQLETSYGYRGDAPPPRAGELRARLDRGLQRDQYDFRLAAAGGYTSNVNAPLDSEDELAGLSSVTKSSALIYAAARLRYDRLVGDNGDRIRFLARAEERAYLDVSNVDRSTLEAAIGYVHLISGSTSEISGFVGYNVRLIDYSSYRRTAFGSLNLTGDFSDRLGFAASLELSSNDDDIEGRDGTAYEGEFSLRQEIATADLLRMGINFRYEDADLESESRSITTGVLSYRHVFALGSMTDFYGILAYEPSYTSYGAPIPTGTTAGVTRHDFTNRIELSVGREMESGITLELNSRYIDRNSNIDSKDSSTFEIMASVAFRLTSPDSQTPVDASGR